MGLSLISLWYLEECSHGIFSKKRRCAVSHFNGGDTQRPHICSGIIVIVKLSLTCYHLHNSESWNFLCLAKLLHLRCHPVWCAYCSSSSSTGTIHNGRYTCTSTIIKSVTPQTHKCILFLPKSMSLTCASEVRRTFCPLMSLWMIQDE